MLEHVTGFYYDEEPAEKPLPKVEAEWPPEAFAKTCRACLRPLRGEEATAGLCLTCQRKARTLTAAEIAEAHEHYQDEAFLDATAEPLPACFDLWPETIRHLFVWHQHDAFKQLLGS